jgi:hypothetical protein
MSTIPPHYPTGRYDPSNPDQCLSNLVVSLTSIVDAYVILDMD